jgi:uncharacterized protein
MWNSTVGIRAGWLSFGGNPIIARQTWAARGLPGTRWLGRYGMLGVLMCGFVLLLGISAARAGEVAYFRIATGAADGTYFPIGSLIASAISNPPGSRDCADGGSCGVPGLIAVGRASKGSVQNVTLIAGGMVESGLSQADIAYMAYFGLGPFKGEAQFDGLRVVATLYPELVQLAVRKHSGIFAVEDLRDRRVSLGVEGSGTAVDADAIMAAHGLTAGSYKALHYDLGEAADRLRLGKLDAFFIIGGTPVPAMADLAEQTNITLLPIHGPAASRLRRDYPFFAPAKLPAGVYRNVAETQTLSVGAQWLVSDRLDAKLVYEMTRALWHPSTRRILDNGHPDGRLIQLNSALDGVGIPLHEGARRYYEEVGALP